MYLFCLCCVFSLLGFVHLELGFCFYVGLLGAFLIFLTGFCVYFGFLFSLPFLLGVFCFWCVCNWVFACLYVGLLGVFFLLLGFVVYIGFLLLSDFWILFVQFAVLGVD